MRRKETYRIILTGILSALAAILMTISIPIPFAPSFLKFDIAELPALFAGFFLGPLSGCMVVVIKNLLHLAFNGTTTAFVGEAMNIFGSLCFVLPAALIYRKIHTRRGAIISMTTATLFASVAAIFLNAYIAFPMYSRLYGLPLEAIIKMGSAVNPLVNGYWSLMILSVLPFNLLKHGITSLVTYILYKRTGNALRRMTGLDEEDVTRKEAVKNEG